MTLSLRTSLFIICLILVASCGQITKGKFDEQAEAAAIRQVLATQQIAWNNGDMEAFMQGYWNSDSLQFVSQRGVNHGWKETLNGYKRGYPDLQSMGTLSFEVLKVKALSEENFVVTGRFHLVRSVGNLDGTFTLIFQKIDGKWVAVYDHTC